jgi:hypothetical protein
VKARPPAGFTVKKQLSHSATQMGTDKVEWRTNDARRPQFPLSVLNLVVSVFSTKSSRRNSVHSAAWLPSQNGLFLECLQAHQARGFFSFTSVMRGENSVPLCEPSQNGCVLDRPQAHHQ